MASYKNAYNQAIARRMHHLNVANLKNDYANSLEQPLHGGGMSGGDFWSDFGDGFMSVMKPIGQVASTVAPFLPLLGLGESGGDMSVNAPYVGYKYGQGMSGGAIPNDGIPPFNVPQNAGMSGGGVSGGLSRKVGCGLSGGDEISDTDHPVLNNPELQATMFLGGRKPSTVSRAEKKRLLHKALADMLLQRQLMAVHGKGLSGGGMSGGDFDWSSLLSFAPLLLGLGMSGGENGYDDLAEFEPLLTGLGMSGGDFWSDIGKGFSDAWNWVTDTAVPAVIGNLDTIGKVADTAGKINKAYQGKGVSGGALSYSGNMAMADAMGDIFSGMGQSGGLKPNSSAVQLYKGGGMSGGGVNQPYHGRGVSGGGTSGGGVSGGDFWSDLGNVASSVAPFLPLLGLGESGGGVSGGKKKAKKQTKQDKMNERLAMKIAHLQGKGLETTPDMEASDKVVGLMARSNPMVNSGSGVSGGKKTSKWIEHVKAYAKQHGIKYGEALKKAKSTYRG